jgi:hypothetical protein
MPGVAVPGPSRTVYSMTISVLYGGTGIGSLIEVSVLKHARFHRGFGLRSGP